jgi:hypothetical protein
MNDTLVLPDHAIEAMTDNLPEASMGLTCIGWKYADRRFTFIDEEDGKRIVIGWPELRKAAALVGTDAWPKGLRRPPFGSPEGSDAWDHWLCNADAAYTDALVQLAAFGEVIYG